MIKFELTEQETNLQKLIEAYKAKEKLEEVYYKLKSSEEMPMLYNKKGVIRPAIKTADLAIVRHALININMEIIEASIELDRLKENNNG